MIHQLRAKEIETGRRTNTPEKTYLTYYLQLSSKKHNKHFVRMICKASQKQHNSQSAPMIQRKLLIIDQSALKKATSNIKVEHKIPT